VRWLPYHRFEISSPLKRGDALAAMAAHVEPVKWFRFSWPSSANDKRFEGEVTADGFNLRRVLGYRNAFRPVLQGQVITAGAVSRIVVTMRPLIFVMLFGAFWMSIVASMMLAGGPGLWIGLLMAVAFYGMAMGGFWFEATKQEQTLREIFRAL
jgi:hypothetical protein